VSVNIAALRRDFRGLPSIRGGASSPAFDVFITHDINGYWQMSADIRADVALSTTPALRMSLRDGRARG
jgi:hypothetical protein